MNQGTSVSKDDGYGLN